MLTTHLSAARQALEQSDEVVDVAEEGRVRVRVRLRVRVRVLVRVRIRVRMRERVARLRDAPHELVEEAVLLVPEGLEGRRGVGLGLRLQVRRLP